MFFRNTFFITLQEWKFFEFLNWKPRIFWRKSEILKKTFLEIWNNIWLLNLFTLKTLSKVTRSIFTTYKYFFTILQLATKSTSMVVESFLKTGHALRKLNETTHIVHSNNVKVLVKILETLEIFKNLHTLFSCATFICFPFQQFHELSHYGYPPAVRCPEDRKQWSMMFNHKCFFPIKPRQKTAWAKFYI